MKKRLLFIFMCLLFVGCTNSSFYETLTYSEVENKINNKENFILYIGQSQCPYCKQYEHSLKRVVDKYNVKVYYIDIGEDSISIEDRSLLSNNIDFSGTPTTIFIKNGEIQGSYNRINGAVDSKKIIEQFKVNGYIKK